MNGADTDKAVGAFSGLKENKQRALPRRRTNVFGGCGRDMSDLAATGSVIAVALGRDEEKLESAIISSHKDDPWSGPHCEEHKIRTSVSLKP